MHQRDGAHPALGLLERHPRRPVAHPARLEAQQGRDRLQVVLDAVVHLADRCLLGQEQPVETPNVGDVAEQDHGPGDHTAGQQRDAVHEDDDVGSTFDLLDDGATGGERPFDGRLLDVEITEAPPLGLGVDPHAVECVDGVGRRELDPPVGVDHDDAVTDPRRLFGADVLVGEREGRLRHHVGQALEHVEVGPLVHARRPLERGQRDAEEGRDHPAFVADRDVLHRDQLAQNRVVDAAAHDLARVQALGHQRPLRLVDRLAHEILFHQGGAVVRSHLPEHHQLGVLLGLRRGCGRVRAVRGGVHRDEQQEIGEGEVGQDAPAPEQPLQMLELLGLEVGMALRELGGGRHQASPPPGSDTGTR